MSYILFTLFVCFIFAVFYFIGEGIKFSLKLSPSLSSVLIGSSIVFGGLFIISYPFVQYERSFFELKFVFLSTMFIFVLLGIIKGKKKANLKAILFTTIYILFFVYLSTKITLGEQMGDNVFYFQEVSLNIDNPILYGFSYVNGIIYDSIVRSNDIYLSFYLSFSILVSMLKDLLASFNQSLLPTYVYNMWLANVLFFGLSSIVIKNIIDYLKIKSKLLMMSLILFLGLYIGTYYYNLTLAHIGNTFLAIPLAFSFMLILDYLKTINKENLIVLLFSLYSIISMGNVGVIIAFYIAFGLFVTSLIYKDKNSFLMIPILFIPVIHYLFLLGTVDSRLSALPLFLNSSYLYLIVFILSCIGLVIYKIESLHKYLFKLSYFLLPIVLLLFIYFSVTHVEDYWIQVLDFTAIKANFDRVQDYFSFNSFNDFLINVVHYLLLLALLLNKETRKVGVILIVLLVFFINPLSYPFIYENILWLYHRAYFVLFNISTIGFGLYAAYNLLEKHVSKVKKLVFIFLSVFSLLYSYINFNNPPSLIYFTGDDFNPLYKLPHSQVEVLEELRQIIMIENYESPNVISQIYATLPYIERLNLIAFSVEQRRSLYKQDDYSDLLKIFYTPVFSGDDGLRFSAPVRDTCKLLMESKIDFVIYNKNLSVYDEKIGAWMPTSWYARDCYTNTFENDDYILYRFFW